MVPGLEDGMIFRIVWLEPRTDEMILVFCLVRDITGNGLVLSFVGSRTEHKKMFAAIAPIS
jgi:hypothetical protein